MKSLPNLNPQAAERRRQYEIKKIKRINIDYVLSVSNSTALKLAPSLVNNLFTWTQYGQ